MSARELIAKIHAADLEAHAAVGRALPAIASAAEAIAGRWSRGGRLFYVGAGTSGRLGALDASELPPTFGIDPKFAIAILAGGRDAFFEAKEGAEDDRAAGARDLERAGVGAKDSIIGISASGTTPFVLGALEHAKKKGALTVAVVCEAASPLEKAADLAIAVPTSLEVVAGSTRMKAGTATKMVLTMLSTAVFAELGLVHRGEMVAMRPTNEKLRRRAERIVRDLLGVADTKARALLLASDWNLPVALVAGKWGLSPDAARARLAAAAGNVGLALERA